MPKRAPTPCRAPYCPELVSDPALAGYCEEHQSIVQERILRRQKTSRTKRRQDVEQFTKDAFYGTSKWRRCRNAYIAAHPLCVMCAEEGQITPAAVVDHIVERRDGGDDYHHNNLQSLCHMCHSIKTHEERRRRDGNNS